MFKMKQIAMVAILGLALVLATATVFATTQSAHAITVVENNGGNPGSASAQNSQGNQNQGNTAASTPSGANGGDHVRFFLLNEGNPAS